MATGIYENRVVSDYVLEVLGLTPSEQSRMLAVKLNSPIADHVSTIARAFEYIEHKPITMRTMMNDSKIMMVLFMF